MSTRTKTNSYYRIACIGECMIELCQHPQQVQLMQRAYGGDTLNTAIYLRRSLAASTTAQVDYITALGDDDFSAELITAWQAEGLGTDLIARLANKLPGLYLIRTTADGERSFFYWREQAAARELFKHEQSEHLLNTLRSYDLIYLSAISLAILDSQSREVLLALLSDIRARGGQIAYDSNYRPRLWHDANETRYWQDRVLAHTTIALPTFSDEAALYDDANIEATADRLLASGITELVIKRGEQSCLIADQHNREHVPALDIASVVDTTAAGDAFNGAYLAAKICGATPKQAALAGHRLAARVVTQQGAIITDSSKTT